MLPSAARGIPTGSFPVTRDQHFPITGAPVGHGLEEMATFVPTDDVSTTESGHRPTLNKRLSAQMGDEEEEQEEQMEEQEEQMESFTIRTSLK